MNATLAFNRIRGVPAHNRGQRTSGQPVFGIFERNSRVYTEIIPHTRKTVLRKTRDLLILRMLYTLMVDVDMMVYLMLGMANTTGLAKNRKVLQMERNSYKWD